MQSSTVGGSRPRCRVRVKQERRLPSWDADCTGWLPLDDASCVGLTSKGSNSGQLQRALAARDVLAVRSLAGELPNVPLPTAAEITLLLLEQEPESYVPAARRLLARLATERTMPLRRLVDVAAILAELEADPAPMAAGKELVSLVEGSGSSN